LKTAALPNRASKIKTFTLVKVEAGMKERQRNEAGRLIQILRAA
jgi:hypothetical protein